MTNAIARFELRYHLKQPLFYILTALFFLLTFSAVTSDAVVIGGGVGNVNRNAPFVIMQFLLVMSVFGVLTTTAFVANAVHRDFELGTDALFFSSPIRLWQYLVGRFLGSFAVGVMVYLGVVLAIMIGSLMPWIDKERLGPFALKPYVFSLFFIVVPTLFLIGAIFFSVAALTRSMMATYSSVVAFFVLYFVSRALMRDIENERIVSVLDPFGVSSFFLATRYWTVFQKNTQILPMGGPFLLNRILWVAIGLLVLGITLWKFDPTKSFRAPKSARNLGGGEPAPLPDSSPSARLGMTQTFGRAASLRQYLATTRIETKAVIKSIPFVIIVLLGVFNIWGNSVAVGRAFGTPLYPVTAVMVRVINNAFALFAVIIAAFYAGDLVFRERTLRLNEVTDAMPVPTWVLWAAKLTALAIISAISIAVAMLTTLTIQTAKGFHHYELGVYGKGLVLEIAPIVLLLAGLAFTLQILLNNKYLGFFGMLLYVVLDSALPALNLEHRLYSFASTPPGDYSDMNGWGHFVIPRLVFFTYWMLFTAMLIVAGHLFWVRGTDAAFRQRVRAARARLSGPAAAALAFCLLAFVATGCYIYYNTNVLNEYRTTKDSERRQADAEKKYKKFQGLPQPRITAVKADVDLDPERRALDIRGVYTIVNKTAKPIADVHVTYNSDLAVADVTIPGAKIRSDDKQAGYRMYTLAQPLAPGATLPMSFHMRYAARGFVNGQSNTNVVENGTFINNFGYFPHLGYNEHIELEDRNKRRKYGLAPIERMKPQSDLQARMNNQISREADWIDLDTTVSTSPDQIALAPGYLQRTWTANGRRYFHYKTTSPILAFWSYLSARYAVKRDTWSPLPSGEGGRRPGEGHESGEKLRPSSAASPHLLPEGEGPVAIEIYYDPKHPYNVDRMIYAVKKSLDYYTRNFSPYQHKQVRILEFPRYSTFAQSFPNTIPFSEGIGFIADLRDKEQIDYVFYVTAHEVAHQWWAHQVIGGNVQGATMLVETMAQYSALMVMEKEYGREKMEKFLRYELDRYLRDRGDELVKEMPLSQVENQPYIHYRKGSLVMYALRDYIGEERVNAALRKFIRDHAFSGPPYTTAGELVRDFREVTPPEYQSVVTDLFEGIVLYDNQTREATATKRADGKYVVKLTVASTKLRSDAKGEEKPVPIDDWIDIGVFAAGKKENLGKPLFMEKRHITKPIESFEIVVSEKPARAGIDPYHKLIDRNPKDNTKSL
ncbi:MAG TPA: M1 family aminopeptidase [Thermoanaerobaculia bacterium]|jgi:ABC-type transport system involved in multi-copper enzyme maturation permease subunit|nr:M1 family aminopeptidase [Thermoanaerobaculia bacterium]